MSTIKTFLKFVLQPISFMLLVLFNAVEFTRKPSLRSVRSGAPNVNFRKSICSADDPGGGGTPHMKGVGMLVVSLRGVNFGFWSHLGYSGQSAIIFSREGLV